MSQDKSEALKQILAQRIMVLDGGMGTQIQSYKLDEADYRGERFADWGQDLKGNNDLLTLTQPALIRDIMVAYLEAGADIVETNTFNSTSIAQADYGMEELVYELNKAGAELAREACEAAASEDKPRFVAGVLGPTNRTASISPDVNDPGYRNVSFDELVQSYTEAIRGLVDGGADLLLIETIFDTLNAKAAIFAIEKYFDERIPPNVLQEGRRPALNRDSLGIPAQSPLKKGGDDSQTGDSPLSQRGARGDLPARLPIMISGTITDASGRTLSGQTTEAFYNSLRHARPLFFGLNCALGPDALRQYVAELNRIAECHVCAHPNAGLPNEFGEYDLGPEEMAEQIGEWAEAGLLNMIGGCCGTTPEHIRAIAEAVEGKAPRKLPELAPVLRLSGLEPFNTAA